MNAAGHRDVTVLLSSAAVMTTLRSSIRTPLLLVGLVLSGCPGEAPKSAQGSRAKPQQTDPKLTQSWSMKAEHSPMASGDLGSNPEATAQALFEQGMPGITHRISKSCSESGVLKDTASVALRFSVGEDGKVGTVASDPPGAAGTCMAKAFTDEVGALKDLPAGAALLRLKFHPPK